MKLCPSQPPERAEGVGWTGAALHARRETGFNTPGDGGLAHARLACVRAHTSPHQAVRDTTSRQCQRALSRVPL